MRKRCTSVDSLIEWDTSGGFEAYCELSDCLIDVLKTRQPDEWLPQRWARGYDREPERYDDAWAAHLSGELAHHLGRRNGGENIMVVRPTVERGRLLVSNRDLVGLPAPLPKAVERHVSSRLEMSIIWNLFEATADAVEFLLSLGLPDGAPLVDPLGPYKQAAWFNRHYGIPGDRLRKAVQRGQLCTRRVSGIVHYSVPQAKERWRDEMADAAARTRIPPRAPSPPRRPT